MTKNKFIALPAVLRKRFWWLGGSVWLSSVLAVHAAVMTNVVAWGAGMIVKASDNNDFGQSKVPANLTNVVFVSGGWRYALVLRSDSGVTGWGDDSLSQTNLVAGTNYIMLACGDFFSLALRADGKVALAGDDFYGQLEAPSNLSNIVSIACGSYHALALRADGTVLAWTTNSGDLDTEDYGQTHVPVGLSNVVAIAGGGWHSLALKSDGTVTAWGRNDFGQGTAAVSNVVAIAAGAAHNLVLKSDGTLMAWGLNVYGEAVVPAGLSNVVAIACGGWHNLALKRDGTVVAWGAGNGSNANVDYKQDAVPTTLTNVIAIAAGKVNSLALVGNAPPLTSALITNAIYGTNGFTVVIPTRNGRVYRLEYKNSLGDTNWTPLPLNAGLGRNLRLNDPTASSAARFYRVRMW